MPIVMTESGGKSLKSMGTARPEPFTAVSKTSELPGTGQERLSRYVEMQKEVSQDRVKAMNTNAPAYHAFWVASSTMRQDSEIRDFGGLWATRLRRR